MVCNSSLLTRFATASITGNTKSRKTTQKHSYLEHQFLQKLRVTKGQNPAFISANYWIPHHKLIHIATGALNMAKVETKI
jgi:hypothetical protein